MIMMIMDENDANKKLNKLVGYQYNTGLLHINIFRLNQTSYL